MDEEVLYPVCPYRNVPTAFERFLGPDSGGIERFLGDEPTGLFHASAALRSACERFERRAAMVGAAAHALLALVLAATQLYSARFVQACRAAHPQMPLLLGPQPLPVSRVWLIAREALPPTGPIPAALFQSCGAWLARTRSHWAAHPQLPLLLGPQPVPALPV